MSNELKVFENEEFGKVRTVEIDGDLWFSGKDVAESLGYINPRKAISDHVDEEDKGVTKCDTLGGKQDMTIINESGLYSLVISSKLPSAKRFKHWVTSEVIPSIRKNGGYIANQENLTPEQIVANALIVANKIIAERDKQIIEMNEKISELQPKATYYDEILSSKDTVLTTNIAKDYGMSAKTFNKLLHDLGVQYKIGEQWVLYSKYQGMGYTHSKTHSYPKNDGSYGTKMQTEWRQAGRLFLYDLLKQNGVLPLIEKNN